MTIGSADPAQSLKTAESLYKQGNLKESEELFQAALSSSTYAGAGHYGIGLIRMKQGQTEDAIEHLTLSTRLDPKNANAWYYLGQIADKQEAGSGQQFYKLALTINPRHDAARNKLKAAAGTSEAALPSEDDHGVYRLIRQDPSPIAREALALIDALNMRVRPHLSAFLGRMIGPLLVALVTFVILRSSGIDRGVRSILGWFLFFMSALVLTLTIARIKTTEIQFGHARLKMSYGLFSRTIVNIELYRVVDVKLHRGILDLLTGNGTITLLEEGRQKREAIHLPGIVQGAELERTLELLRNLVFTLRSGPWGKGVIY